MFSCEFFFFFFKQNVGFFFFFFNLIFDLYISNTAGPPVVQNTGASVPTIPTNRARVRILIRPATTDGNEKRVSAARALRVCLCV